MECRLTVNQLLRDRGFDSLGSYVDTSEFLRLLQAGGIILILIGFLILIMIKSPRTFAIRVVIGGICVIFGGVVVWICMNAGA